ncbi:chromate efflux transporter [Comamonas aquatica]|uniref:chromate efflux transporter n=1 Tax=Comamonas aquatica TaxID=225991 RepID=UPI001E7602B4|nr:chromate transporter, chromate ion transporter (CHR) family [Comamonas aquatica]
MSRPPPPRCPHLPLHGAGRWKCLPFFLRLGLTSFGGPTAHLGYFQTEFVQRRRWLSDAHYAELVALCQFLPGPASSQVGMALGQWRAGWAGMAAAWLGFTLPSALALVALAVGLSNTPHLAYSGLLHGLKLVAVAVVAHAVWGMARSLCPDLWRRALAVVACAALLAWPQASVQLGVIALGAAAALLRQPTEPPVNTSAWPTSSRARRTGYALLYLFALLLIALPVAAALWPHTALQAFAAFYQAGALVFGGGHVVLPLLQTAVVPNGWVAADSFVAGYAAAQAVPGPLFTLAAYLGALLPLGPAWSPWMGGLLMLLAIFLPATLLVAGALPLWAQLRQRPHMRQAVTGINAVVVGILAATWYHPVLTSAIGSLLDVGVALLYLGLLLWRLPPVAVVALAAGLGWVLA